MNEAQLAAQLIINDDIFTLHVSNDEEVLTSILLTALEKEKSGTIGRIMNLNTQAILFETRKQAV